MATPKQLRALSLIDKHEPQTPAQFARLMWPDNPGWRRIGKCGAYGSTSGVGMRLAGGAYLGKLKKAGLIHHAFGSIPYRLTRFGHETLAKAGDDA